MTRQNTFELNSAFERVQTDELIGYYNAAAAGAGMALRMIPVRSSGETGRHLMKQLQHAAGDAMIVDSNGIRLTVDFKCERKSSPNLFIETFSNLAASNPTLGWLHTLNADRIWYYFADKRRLLVLHLPELRKWLFEPNGNEARLLSFRERQQTTHPQKNNTIGRLVPIRQIPAHVLLRDINLPTKLTELPAWTESGISAIQ